MHYDFGDGSGLYEVMVPNEDNHEVCTVKNTQAGVECVFDAMECPVPGTPGVDGHDEPGVVECTGCEGQSTFTISEAKCCLAFQVPYNPATQQPDGC